MDNYQKTVGATGAFQTSRIVVFRKQCHDSNTVTYAAINKSDHEVEIKFDQTKSTNMLYIPSKGTVRTVIHPKAIVYLASSIITPGFSTYRYAYTFNQRIIS